MHLPVLGSLHIALQQFDSVSTSSQSLEHNTVPGSESLFKKFTENMKPHQDIDQNDFDFWNMQTFMDVAGYEPRCPGHCTT